MLDNKEELQIWYLNITQILKINYDCGTRQGTKLYTTKNGTNRKHSKMEILNPTILIMILNINNLNTN